MTAQTKGLRRCREEARGGAGAQAARLAWLAVQQFAGITARLCRAAAPTLSDRSRRIVNEELNYEEAMGNISVFFGLNDLLILRTAENRPFKVVPCCR